jgi:uncharacterized protein
MAIAGKVQFEELTPEDCLNLLDLASVGRIGLSVNALPVILPVNFVMHDGDVVFRVGPGTKLATARGGAVVAFEVDHHDPHGSRGWSVLIQGRSEEILERGELTEARRLPIHSWALDGSADHYVRIHPTIITGRRFQPERGDIPIDTIS